MSNPTDPDATLLTDYFGPLEPVWVPDTSVTDGKRLTVVPVAKLYGDPLYGKTRGVRVDQGTNTWLQFVPYSPQTGAPLSISVGGYSTPPTVEVRYREASGSLPSIFVPDDGDVPALASDGRSVYLPLPVELKDLPGVYNAQMMVRDGSGQERLRGDFYVLVDRGMWDSSGGTPTDSGPVTVQEVQTALRDHPGANRLLGNFEFDLAEIAQAIVSAVQTFNMTSPLGCPMLSTRNFPTHWRRNMLDGCMSYLWETASTYFRRGDLQYQAGGAAVADLAKNRDYSEAAMMYRERYSKWCREVKTRASIDAGWGALGSGSTWYGTV